MNTLDAIPALIVALLGFLLIVWIVMWLMVPLMLHRTGKDVRLIREAVQRTDRIDKLLDLCKQVDEAAAALIAAFPAIPAAKSKPDNTPTIDRRTK